MTTAIHPDFIGLPASAVAAALGYERPKPRTPRPPSATARAGKAASRTIDAIARIEEIRPWRDVDVERGLRAAMALAQAYADVLYDRRLAEVGTLPEGLRLEQQVHDHDYYEVVDVQGDQVFEVERRMPASQIWQMAECYLEGRRQGRLHELRKQATEVNRRVRQGDQ